jgi:hypothetical protein
MRRSVSCLAVAAVLLAACDSTEPRVPTSLALDREAVTLQVYDSVEVQALILDQFGVEYGSIPAGVQLSWTVADPTIAQASDGVITALLPGSTVVTVDAAGLTPAELRVEVVEVELEGRLSFAYAGHSAGDFAVDESFLLNPLTGPTTPSWVVTFHDEEYGSQDVIAQRLRTDGSIDLIWFWVAGEITEPGAHEPLDGMLLLGYVPQLNAADAMYAVTGGSIVFADVNGERLTGSFSLQLEDATGNIVTVTDGMFDAPVVPVSAILSGEMAEDAAAAGVLDPALRGLLPQRRFR